MAWGMGHRPRVAEGVQAGPLVIIIIINCGVDYLHRCKAAVRAVPLSPLQYSVKKLVITLS